MFICEPCLKQNYDNWAVFQSLGKCDICEKKQLCFDIPSSNLIPKNKTLKVKAK